MIKLGGKRRLTKVELEDIRDNSGITNLQYEIVRLKYFDSNQYSVIKICDLLKISVGTYGYQLKQAETQVNGYYSAKSVR
jgi:hypothetical protein